MTLYRAKILVVDNNPQNLDLLKWLPAGLETDLTGDRSALEALGVALDQSFAVAIVEAEAAGTAVAGTAAEETAAEETVDAEMAAEETTGRLPVILVSGSDFLAAEGVLGEVEIVRDLDRQRQQLKAQVEQLRQANEQLRQRISQLESNSEERTNALQQAYSQLELLDKNKSDFIAVVSHELRTPLTLIQGYSEMMLTEAGVTPERQMDHLVGIASGVERMHEIVNLMLDMVQLDNRTFNLAPEPLNLYALFLMIKEALEPALEQRSLSLRLEGLQTLPLVTADTEALHKLFEHLLSNAIRFTPDEGHISISGRLLPDETAPHVEVIIKDTGIGIDPESHELIFTKFYQTGDVTFHSSGKTKFKGGGAGLGLAIARGIVEAHKGRIWVESTGYDERSYPGSEFHVVLPVEGPPV